MDITRRDALKLGGAAAAAVPLAAVLGGEAHAAGSPVLGSGQSLRANQSITSTSGGWTFVMQGDGNAVLRNSAGAAVWSTGTQGHPGAVITMQTDGNLVVGLGHTALWYTGTNGRAGAELQIATNGNLIVYQQGNPVWARAQGKIVYPAYHPMSIPGVGASKQAVVAYGDSITSTYATVYTWQRAASGAWGQQFAAVRGRVGYNGWARAASRVQNDGTSPAGTFYLAKAYGFGAAPGGRMTYTPLTSTSYRSGDPADPKTYNVHQTSASATRTWRATDDFSERYADFPTQYEYLVDIFVYEPGPASISYDSAHGEYVTSAPAAIGHGFAIYLHIDGAGDTAGCVSIPRTNLIQTLRWLDPAQTPRIAMAPAEWMSSI